MMVMLCQWGGNHRSDVSLSDAMCVLYVVFQKRPPSIFLKYLSGKWTDFHIFWYTESWMNLTQVILHCPPHSMNVTALPREMQRLFSWSVLHCFPFKNAGFEYNRLLCCIETSSIPETVKNYYRLHWHNVPVFLDIDLTHHPPCCAIYWDIGWIADVSINRWCSTVVRDVVLFGCNWPVCQVTLWVLMRATVNNLSSVKE